MGREVIGRVKSGSGKSWDVKWDQKDSEVWVQASGWTSPERAGRASSAGEAMRKAEAYLYNK
jgi:hypothetical protein